MKDEEKITLAFILILTFSLSAYSVTYGHMLDVKSYSELLLAKSAVYGKLSGPTPLLYQLTAFIYNSLNSGGADFNPTLMLNIAKVLPIIFSLACVLSFYFMLKSMFSEIAATAGAVLLVSSLPFVIMMGSGVYTTEALGMCLFTVAAFAFFLFYSRKNYLFLLASALVFILSGMSWVIGWAMIGAFLLSLLAQLVYSWRGRFDSTLAQGAAAVLVAFIAVYFLVPQGNVFVNMTTANFNAYTLSIPLVVVGIFAFISWIIGKHKRRSEFGVFAASMFLLSVVILLYQYSPAAFGIALFSAFAVNELLELRNEDLAIALFAGSLFFLSFIFSVNFLDVYQALIASGGVALTSVFIAALYRERRVVAYITFSVIALFLFSSVSAAIISASQRQDLAGSGADSLMSWIAENLPDNATVWSFRVSPMIEFTTGRKGYYNDTEFASFLLSNQSADYLEERNVTDIVVDTTLLDSIETIKSIANNSRVRIESFRFWNRESDGTNVYAVFISNYGNAIEMQLNPITGIPIEGNVRLLTRDNQMRIISSKNLLMLGQGRLVYPEDNYKVNLFMMFFGKVDGLRPEYASGSGDIMMFEVVK